MTSLHGGPSMRAETLGRAHVRNMMGLLGAAVVAYVGLHLVLRDPAPNDATGCSPAPTWQCFARIEAPGDVRWTDPGDLAWYVDARIVDGVRAQARLNSERMDELRRRVGLQAATRIAPLLNDRSPVDALIRQVFQGQSMTARAELMGIIESLSPQTTEAAAAELSAISADLDRLIELERRQQTLVESLAPPLAQGFVWRSPEYALPEAFFWALFGVLTNLLVHGAESVRRGDFRPPERWVAYAKLTYGPILALALVLAMMNGLFPLDRAPSRIWTLPLVSFLFGYASRRIAHTLDRLLERLLGPAGSVARREPPEESARRRAIVDRLMAASRPGTLDELRTQLKQLAREVVVSEASARRRR